VNRLASGILRGKVSIRVTILTIFVFVFFLLSSLALGLQYYFSLNLAHSAAERSFEYSADQARERLEKLDIQNASLVSALARYVDLISQYDRAGSSIRADAYLYLDLFTGIMGRNLHIRAIYVSHDGDDFIELIDLNSGRGLRESLGAGKDDRWALIEISKAIGAGMRKVTFFDQKLAMRDSRIEPTDYSPKTRPWFRLSLESDGVARTDPYIFATSQTPGVTYAMKLDNGVGVAGLDMTLEELSDFLRKQDLFAGCELTLFDKEGLTLAHAVTGSKENAPSSLITEEISPSTRKLIGQSLSANGKPEAGLGRFTVQGLDYYYYAERLEPDESMNLYLGITAPVSVFSKNYVDQVKASMGTTLGLLLLLVPVIWYLSSVIVRPIKALSRENEKVGQRRFEEVRVVESRIKEVFELSSSILSMSLSIKAHEEAERELMDSIIKLVAGAIDAKSPYTGGHCSRVPVIAGMLVKAASDSGQPPFADFGFQTEDEWREFHIASWLHDCGKVTTPEYVVDKATKLETIHNRIHEIRTRFEVLLRDAEIDYYRKLAQGEGDPAGLMAELEERKQSIRDDFAFVAECNVGGEFMSEDKIVRLQEIAKRTWTRTLDNRLGISSEESRRLESIAPEQLPVTERILEDRPEHIVARTQNPFGGNERGFKMEVPKNLYNHGELYNLSIQKGTLNAEERFKINDHIIQSIIMLEALPFPEGLTRVPEYAGAHHETLIGTGYPRRLTKDDMSIPARIMAVADVFEALTASDRPYKKAKTLSQAIRIMSFMARDQHLDPDIFRLFLSSGVYLEYAKTYLAPAQIDEVDAASYLASA